MPPSLHCRTAGHAHSQRAALQFYFCLPIAGLLPVLSLQGSGLCKDKLCHFHFRHGNGSGLIHTQYIYPRQCLYTFHVMDQYLLFSKPHHRHHHRHTCKKVQAFRDHSENSRHHARHTIFHRCPGKKYCCKNRIAPIGKMITPTVCTRRFNARIISDCSPSFVCVACNISPEI